MCRAFGVPLLNVCVGKAAQCSDLGLHAMLGIVPANLFLPGTANR